MFRNRPESVPASSAIWLGNIGHIDDADTAKQVLPLSIQVGTWLPVVTASCRWKFQVPVDATASPTSEDSASPICADILSESCKSERVTLGGENVHIRRERRPACHPAEFSQILFQDHTIHCLREKRGVGHQSHRQDNTEQGQQDQPAVILLTPRDQQKKSGKRSNKSPPGRLLAILNQHPT